MVILPFYTDEHVSSTTAIAFVFILISLARYLDKELKKIDELEKRIHRLEKVK